MVFRRMAVGLKQTWQGTQHFRPLDGLRGVAVSMVFWCHYGQTFKGTWWGWTGVDLFFVLSGFLITGILFDAPRIHGYFSTFYKRRSLRIFPLYFCFWGVVLLVKLALRLKWPFIDLAWLGYLGNFLPLVAIHRGIDGDFYTNLWLHNIQSAGNHATIVIGHFWSLCVEEQFYLVWPVLVWFCRSRRALMWLCGAGVAGTLLLRIALNVLLPASALNTDLIYKLTFTRADTLLMGAWLALYLRRGSPMPARHAAIAYLAGASALLLLVASPMYFHTTPADRFAPHWLSTYGFSLPGIIGVSVLVAAIRLVSVQEVLMWKPLLALGKVSYGFYVLHLVLIGLFPQTVQPGSFPRLSIGLVLFVGTWSLSAISFRLLEQPFLRLKDRWAPAREAPVTGTSASPAMASDTPILTKIAA